MARCLTILADGLRPDAITPGTAPRMSRLTARAAHATDAVTVRPSVTVAAHTTLATGVAPATHGLVQPGLGFLSRLPALRPIARELAREGLPTTVVMGPLSPTTRPVCWALATCAGVGRVVPAEEGATRIAEAALVEWLTMGDGLLFVYLPDCDVAGHKEGWMSPAYLRAVAAVDVAASRLAAAAGDALFVLLADHGGGGVLPNEHDTPHPINEMIPIMLAGPDVRAGHMKQPISLLDVPPTLLHWFGLPIPESYEGRPLTEAFARATQEVA